MYLASTTSTTSSIINHHHLIRECLKSYLFFNHCQSLETQPRFNQQHNLVSQPATTVFSSFTNVSIISDEVIPLFNKAFDIGYTLWRRHYHCTEIKESTLAVCNLCKYIRKVVACIVLISKNRSGPDIQLKTLKQAKSIESMMRIIWSMKAIRWQKKASRMPD